MSDTSAAAPAAVMKPPRSGGTVTVACKLPNGLVLQTSTKTEVQEQMYGGGVRMVDQWLRDPDGYTLYGPALSVETMQRGDIPFVSVSGFALTPNIPQDFWERWLEQHKHMDIVTKGLVFAFSKDEDVRAKARELAGLKTGMEPLNADDPASSSPEFRRVRRDTGRDARDDEPGM